MCGQHNLWEKYYFLMIETAKNVDNIYIPKETNHATIFLSMSDADWMLP